MDVKSLDLSAFELKELHDKLVSTKATNFDEFKQMVRQFLQQQSSNVYDGVLDLIDAILVIQDPKSSYGVVPHKVIIELSKFLNDGSCSKSNVTQEAMARVLNFTTSTVSREWLKLIFEVYQVDKLDNRIVIDIINSYLAENLFYEAAYISKALKCQSNFHIEQIAMPLVIQNKFWTFPGYFDGCPEYAFNFVIYLDNLQDLRGLKTHFSYVPNAAQITRPSLDKIMTKLIKQFDIDQSYYPRMLFNKAMGAVSYLMKKRYREKNLLANDFEELAKIQIEYFPDAQLQILYELIKYNDTITALKFANMFNVDVTRRPWQIRKGPLAAVPDCKHEFSDKFLKLSDFHESATFIDTPELLIQTCNSIEKNCDVIGVDCEWTPVMNYLAGQRETASIFQIATKDEVFVIDVRRLFCDEVLWELFVSKIMNSDLMKLGFGFETDLDVLRNSVHKNTELVPKKVLDLNRFGEWLMCTVDGLVDEVTTKAADEFKLKGLTRISFLFLGKELDKWSQFSYWDRRPLTNDQFEYAALDAVVLIKIFEELKTRCSNLNVDFVEKVETFMSGKFVMPPKKDQDKGDTVEQVPGQ